MENLFHWRFFGLLCLTGYHLTAIEIKEKCSKFVGNESLTEDKHSVFTFKQISSKYPIQIFFDHPVADIETDYLEAKSLSPAEWELRVPENGSESSLQDGVVEIQVVPLEKAPSVTTIKEGGIVACEEIVRPLESCGSHGTFDNRPEEVLKVTASWGTGANYDVAVASPPDYVGYRMDIFFDKPVTSLQVFAGPVQTLMSSPLHWVILKEWTDLACKKLVKFRFGISFEYPSKVEALLLNGKSILGLENPTGMIFENDIDDEAIGKNCEDFFRTQDPPWFGLEKARSLWFELTFRPLQKVGLVIDIVFADPVTEIRTWHFSVTKLDDYHFRVHNPGWILTPVTSFRFHAIYVYPVHYHVQFRGIAVNGQVLCGLAASPIFKPAHLHVNVTEKFSKQSNEFKTWFILLTVCLVFVSIVVVLIVIVSVIILVRGLKETLYERRHLYERASNQRTPERSDTMYAYINEGTTKEEGIYTSHM